jgi:hypothetical protein
MGCAWLLKRLVYLVALTAVPTSAIVTLARDWNPIAAFLNGTWPQWVTNVANVAQISGAIAALAWWLSRIVGPHSTEPGDGAAARLLRLLALLLPARDRERFVGEVLANMAGLRWRERIEEFMSVAAAMPGIAAIVRWARRRRA